MRALALLLLPALALAADDPPGRYDLTGVHVSGIVLSAAILVLLALLVLRRAVARCCCPLPYEIPDAYNFEMELRLLRPPMDKQEDKGGEQAMAGAIVCVAVPLARATFSWTTPSMQIEAEMSTNSRRGAADLDTSLRGGAGATPRITIAPDAASLQGAAVLLAKTDEQGRCLLQWRGDPSPVLEIQATALYNPVAYGPAGVSAPDAARVDDDRARYRKQLSRVVPTARTRLASMVDDVDVDVAALQLRLHAALRFEPNNSAFTQPRVAEGLLEQVAATLRAYNDLLEQKGMDPLHVAIECQTDGDGRRMAELSKLRAAAVKRRLIRILRDGTADGRGGPGEEAFWRRTLLARGYVSSHAVSDTGRRHGGVIMRLLSPEEVHLDRRQNAHLHRPPPRTPLHEQRRRRIRELMRAWAGQVVAARDQANTLHLATAEPVVVIPEGGLTRAMDEEAGNVRDSQETSVADETEVGEGEDDLTARVRALLRKVRRYEDCPVYLAASDGAGAAHVRALRRFRLKAARHATRQSEKRVQRRSSSGTIESDAGPGYV